MQTIFRKRNCWNIASTNQYIATFGSGVTVLNRSTLEEIHHFTGIKSIIGGTFISEDILVVYTTEQKLFFLRISEKKVIWTCPRHKKLSPFGDIRCCSIPGTRKIACIATGKRGLEEHFLMLVDFEEETVSLKEIPNCSRVVHSLTWTKEFGLSFLSYEAKGNGTLFYKIFRVSDSGDSTMLCEWESSETINAYWGDFIFMRNSKPNLHLSGYKLILSPQTQKIELQSSFLIPFPRFSSHGLVGADKEYIPSITWIDKNRGFIIGHTSNWIGVYDFINDKLVAEYCQPQISCGAIIDKTILIGCLPGLFADELSIT